MRKFIWIIMFGLFFSPLSSYALELIPGGESGILIEAGSGKILYEKEKDKRLFTFYLCFNNI